MGGGARLELALQVGKTVAGDYYELPPSLTGVEEQVDVFGFARHVVEVDFAVFPVRHGSISRKKHLYREERVVAFWGWARVGA